MAYPTHDPRIIQERLAAERRAELARFDAPLEDEEGALFTTGRLGTPPVFAPSEELLPPVYSAAPKPEMPDTEVWKRASEAAGLGTAPRPTLAKTGEQGTNLVQTSTGSTISGGPASTTMTRGNASMTMAGAPPAPGQGRIPASLAARSMDSDDINSAGFIRPLERDGGLLDPSKRNAMRVLDNAYGQKGYPTSDPEAVRSADLGGLAYDAARGTAAARAKNPLGFQGDQVAAEMQAATGMNKEQFMQTMLDADRANARKEGRGWNKSEAMFAAQAAWLDFLGMFVRNQRGGYREPIPLTYDNVLAARGLQE